MEPSKDGKTEKEEDLEGWFGGRDAGACVYHHDEHSDEKAHFAELPPHFGAEDLGSRFEHARLRLQVLCLFVDGLERDAILQRHLDVLLHYHLDALDLGQSAVQSVDARLRRTKREHETQSSQTPPWEAINRKTHAPFV